MWKPLPCDGEPVRCALTPSPVPACDPAKGEAAMADVDAVRRSIVDSAAASEKAPGAVPGRFELLSGAAPDDACIGYPL